MVSSEDFPVKTDPLRKNQIGEVEFQIIKNNCVKVDHS